MSSTHAAPTIDLTGRSALSERIRERAFEAMLFFALLFALGFLLILLVDITSDAAPVLQDRGTAFLTDKLSNRISRTGLSQALVGSFQIAIITAGVAIPLGVATAIHLEEFAGRSRFATIIDVNIRNLAGVPSIVYGLLGLAIYARFLEPLTGGKTALAGGLTLATLALPIVVIASAEAIRAVPRGLRDAGLGLGATRWQVIRKLVLPAAAPGILTGTILALARAIGETAPLLVVGAATFLSFEPGLLDLRESFTALPMMIFSYAKVPQREFVEQAAPATILVLLAFTLSMNAVAIFLRNRFEQRNA